MSSMNGRRVQQLTAAAIGATAVVIAGFFVWLLLLRTPPFEPLALTFPTIVDQRDDGTLYVPSVEVCNPDCVRLSPAVPVSQGYVPTSSTFVVDAEPDQLVSDVEGDAPGVRIRGERTWQETDLAGPCLGLRSVNPGAESASTTIIPPGEYVLQPYDNPLPQSVIDFVNARGVPCHVELVGSIKVLHPGGQTVRYRTEPVWLVPDVLVGDD